MMATKEEIFKIGENYKSEQLEAQSRAAIKAWCDDPSVQLEFCDKESIHWVLLDHARFNTYSYYYRIAKPKKWYRVCELYDGRTLVANTDADEMSLGRYSEFKKWLDERKYYD